LVKMHTSRMPWTLPVCSETTIRVAPRYSRYSQAAVKSGTTASTPSRTMKAEYHWATIAMPRASARSLTTSLGGKKPARAVPQ
jgi:hypothetical protein